MPSWLIEESLHCAWQHSQGRRPGDARYECGRHSEGACRSHYTHLRTPGHKFQRRLAEHLEAFGVWQPATALAAPSVLPQLNEQQVRALHVVQSGRNLFLTGGAGVGKSFTVKECIRELERMHGEGAVACTATTGIAGEPLHGKTIHSFVGAWGAMLPDEPSPSAVDRWRAAKALVIDEISMMDADFLDAIELHGRLARNSSRPFGGVQIILVGDFFQLPPISHNYAFRSAAWRAADFVAVVLTDLVRQSGDMLLGSVAARMRVGTYANADAALLEGCVGREEPRDGIQPTVLFCTNVNTDGENEKELAKLPGEPRRYRAIDSLRHLDGLTEDEADVRAMELAIAAAEVARLDVWLKVGAQVLLTRNWPELGLVNGSRGMVLGFGEAPMGEQQVAQGLPKPLRGVAVLPLVRFTTPRGLVNVFVPLSLHAVGNAEEGVLQRAQLPLRLAWAITIHKSQGMSLDRAALDAAGAFSSGQVYVGLSRLRSREGLYLRRPIEGKWVRACDEVRQFYSHLLEG